MGARIRSDGSRSDLLHQVRFAGVLSSAVACAAAAGIDLNQYLNSHYRDKTFFIRNFYKDSDVRYDSAGNPLGSVHTGYWTVDGAVQIKKIKVSGSLLRVNGKRLYLDVERGGALGFRGGGRSVEIEAELDPAHPPTTSDFDALLARIFLTQNDNLLNLVPDYWRPCLTQALTPIAGKKHYDCRLQSAAGIPLSPQISPSAENSSKDATFGQNDSLDLQAIHHGSEKGILPPRRTHGEEPEFSAQARETHAAGVVTLKLIVDQSGRPRNIQIIGPRGLGLDENAVERVSTWQFAPATKEGNRSTQRLPSKLTFTTNRRRTIDANTSGVPQSPFPAHPRKLPAQ